jgi:hypothetical protein
MSRVFRWLEPRLPIAVERSRYGLQMISAWRGRCLCRKRHRSASRGNHVHLALDQIGDK